MLKSVSKPQQTVSRAHAVDKHHVPWYYHDDEKQYRMWSANYLMDAEAVPDAPV